jgi:hypothetical protein
MEYATLRLSDRNDHNKYFDLKYKLKQNSFTEKWIDCVLEAQQNQYPISEPWAIYNLNDNLNNEFIKDRINKLIADVDSVCELFGFRIDSISDQETLNRIHAIFEEHHGKLDEWKSNPLFRDKPASFRKNLSEINQFVHVCESSEGSPKIRVVWFDLPKTKRFDDSDYALFTNKRKFGSLYHLYTDVGKNIEALSEDNDQHHHDIVPNLHYSADCVSYFCDDTQEQVDSTENKHRQYIEQNKDLLEQKGYTTDDKRLTTGRIEIGSLQTDMSNTQILENMKDFNHIQSFFLS